MDAVGTVRAQSPTIDQIVSENAGKHPVVCETHGNLHIRRSIVGVFCGLCRDIARFEAARADDIGLDLLR